MNKLVCLLVGLFILGGNAWAKLDDERIGRRPSAEDAKSCPTCGINHTPQNGDLEKIAEKAKEQASKKDCEDLNFTASDMQFLESVDQIHEQALEAGATNIGEKVLSAVEGYISKRADIKGNETFKKGLLRLAAAQLGAKEGLRLFSVREKLTREMLLGKSKSDPKNALDKADTTLIQAMKENGLGDVTPFNQETVNSLKSAGVELTSDGFDLSKFDTKKLDNPTVKKAFLDIYPEAEDQIKDLKDPKRRGLVFIRDQVFLPNTYKDNPKYSGRPVHTALRADEWKRHIDFHAQKIKSDLTEMVKASKKDTGIGNSIMMAFGKHEVFNTNNEIAGKLHSSALNHLTTMRDKYGYPNAIVREMMKDIGDKATVVGKNFIDTVDSNQNNFAMTVASVIPFAGWARAIGAAKTIKWTAVGLGFGAGSMAVNAAVKNSYDKKGWLCHLENGLSNETGNLFMMSALLGPSMELMSMGKTAKVAGVTVMGAMTAMGTIGAVQQTSEGMHKADVAKEYEKEGKTEIANEFKKESREAYAHAAESFTFATVLPGFSAAKGIKASGGFAKFTSETKQGVKDIYQGMKDVYDRGAYENGKSIGYAGAKALDKVTSVDTKNIWSQETKTAVQEGKVALQTLAAGIQLKVEAAAASLASVRGSTKVEHESALGKTYEQDVAEASKRIVQGRDNKGRFSENKEMTPEELASFRERMPEVLPEGYVKNPGAKELAEIEAKYLAELVKPSGRTLAKPENMKLDPKIQEKFQQEWGKLSEFEQQALLRRLYAMEARLVARSGNSANSSLNQVKLAELRARVSNKVRNRLNEAISACAK